MTSHRTGLGGLILVLLAGCAAPADEEPTVDVAAVEAATTDAFTAFTEAVVGENVQAAAQYVTEDTHFMEPGILINGRQEFVDFVQGLVDAGADITAFDFSRHNIFVHPGAAYEYGTYDETVVMDGEENMVEGNYFVRWEQGEDGQWRMDGVVAGPRNAPEEGM